MCKVVRRPNGVDILGKRSLVRLEFVADCIPGLTLHPLQTDRVRTSVQMIDESSGRPVWLPVEQFSRSLLFAPDEISVVNSTLSCMHRPLVSKGSYAMGFTLDLDEQMLREIHTWLPRVQRTSALTYSIFHSLHRDLFDAVWLPVEGTIVGLVAAACVLDDMAYRDSLDAAINSAAGKRIFSSSRLIGLLRTSVTISLIAEAYRRSESLE